MAQKCYNRKRVRFYTFAPRENPCIKQIGATGRSPLGCGRKERGRGFEAHALYCGAASAYPHAERFTPARFKCSLGSRLAARTAPSQTNADIENMIAIAGVVIDRFNTVEKELVTVS